jgi:hypothetical protein
MPRPGEDVWLVEVKSTETFAIRARTAKEALDKFDASEDPYEEFTTSDWVSLPKVHRPKCPDCGEPWPMMFVVKPGLWKRHSKGKDETPCMWCFCDRLGRNLRASDLIDAPVNDRLKVMLARKGFWKLTKPEAYSLLEPMEGT